MSTSTRRPSSYEALPSRDDAWALSTKGANHGKRSHIRSTAAGGSLAALLALAPGSTLAETPSWSGQGTLGPTLLLRSKSKAVTQQTSLLVEPSRVATASAGIEVVAVTDQSFTWVVQCFGLAETACLAELRRLSPVTIAIDGIAAAAASLVFAVSPDGKQIAFADDTSLYFKTISP